LRFLVASLPVSIVYDVLWAVCKSSEYWEDKMENGMSQVILVLIVFLIFYKMVLMVVMWKASINY
jgi:hypothetical protein